MQQKVKYNLLSTTYAIELGSSLTPASRGLSTQTYTGRSSTTTLKALLNILKLTIF